LQVPRRRRGCSAAQIGLWPKELATGTGRKPHRARQVPAL